MLSRMNRQFALRSSRRNIERMVVDGEIAPASVDGQCRSRQSAYGLVKIETPRRKCSNKTNKLDKIGVYVNSVAFGLSETQAEAEKQSK